MCLNCIYGAVVAEWLRRLTRNQMGFPRAGSNPAGCERVLFLKTKNRCTNKRKRKKMPPVRIELTTPGLRDQCSTTELKRPSPPKGAEHFTGIFERHIENWGFFVDISSPSKVKNALNNDDFFLSNNFRDSLLRLQWRNRLAHGTYRQYRDMPGL